MNAPTSKSLGLRGTISTTEKVVLFSTGSGVDSGLGSVGFVSIWAKTREVM